MTDAERLLRKALRYAEWYGIGDIKIAHMTGQYPNPSFVDADVAEFERKLLGDDNGQ